MGIPASIGIVALLAKPTGDLADYVATGTMTGVGPSVPYMVLGPFNICIWASINTALTTTAGSLSISVASGTGLAAGASVNSVNVPPGTTLATLTGTSGTLALPTVTLAGFSIAPTAEIIGLSTAYPLANLLGATVTGPNIPGSTTVSAVDAVNGIVTLNNAPTAATPTKNPQFFAFALTDSAITVSGADSAATFTGAGVVWSGKVNIERSFDGGSTWIVVNVGGGGDIAQFRSGPVSLSFGEPERGVLYRLNCIAYTSGTINYRLSVSGAAAASLGFNQLS